jgi:hypothetical protein
VMASVRDTIYEVTPDGIKLHFHSGQWQAWDSTARFTAVLAGTQAGKTIYGPWWLAREIEQRGRGDYLAVTATYDLFKLKMLPAIREVFEGVLGVGRYWASDRIMEVAEPGGRFWARKSDDPMYARIVLRSAEAPGGLESGTAKAAWLDEAGQNSFRVESWYATLRRLSLALGRVLITTTLFNFGWLKTEVYDRWKKGNSTYNVIQFRSIDNPLFDAEEWQRAKEEMPAWRFAMQYEGRYERPAGLIYDCFNDRLGYHVCRPFAVPDDWPRYLGLDFGGVNTAGVFLANEPGTDRHYLYREYLEGGRTAKTHAEALDAGEPMMPVCVGGSRSEGQWRDEFAAAGLPVMAPDVADVEVGISRVYGAIKQGNLIIFEDCVGVLDQLRSYSRTLDAAGQPTEKIQDKETYHYLDAVRAIGTLLWSGHQPQHTYAGGQRAHLGYAQAQHGGGRYR